jgi:hypothetical protein
MGLNPHFVMSLHRTFRFGWCDSGQWALALGVKLFECETVKKLTVEQFVHASHPL